MATRTISTKLAIEGESEYQAKVRQINSELKTLQAQLKMVQSEYQNQANSLEALTAKESALQAVQEKQTAKVKEISAAFRNAQSAVDGYKQKKAELEEKLRANAEAMDRLKKAAGDTSGEEQRLTKENAELNEELAITERALEAAEKGVTNWETKLYNAQTDLNNTNTALDENSRYMEEAKASADKCATSIDQYGNKVKGAKGGTDDLKNSDKDLDSAQKSAADSARDQGEALGALASLVAASGLKRGFEEIVEALQKCVEVSADFEYAMASVAAIAGASDSELDALSNTAKEYAASSVFTAQEVASAYNYMAMAGWDASSMLSGLPGIMSLASASGEDLGNVCDIVTDALTAFGLTAADSAHFSDVLAQAAASSNTNVGLMGNSFRMVATSAGALGYSIDDVAVALGTMANNGLKGEMAGAALATALTRMSGTNSNATKAMKDLNLQMFNMDGSAKDLGVFLDELRDAFEGLTDKEKESYAYLLAGQRGMKGLLAIVNAAPTDWNNLTEAIRDCNGASQEMSDIKLDTYQGQVKLLESAMEALEIAVGDRLRPALGSLAEAGADAAAWAADFVSKNEAVVPIIGAVASALGVLTGAITAVGLAATIGAKLMENLNRVLAANPWILAATAAAAAIAALTTAIVLANAESQSADDSYNHLKKTMGDLADAMEASQDAYDEASGAVAENRANVESLVEQLTELSEKQDKSAADMELMRGIIEQLNTAVPDLNLSYDELNGTLSMTAEQILAVARAQAEADQYAADVQRLIDAESLKTQAYEAEQEALDHLNAKRQELAEYEEKYGENINIEQYAMLSDAVHDAEDAYTDATEAVQASEEAYTEAEAAVNAYAEAHGAASEAAGQMADAAGEVSLELGDLAADYMDLKDKATESINSQIGLFDSFAAEVNEDLDSTDEMMARWSEQAQNMALYTENLRKAAVYGIDEGLVLSLADGSTESAGYLAAIIQSVEEAGGSLEGMGPEAQAAVDELNAAFAGTAQARNELAIMQAALETDFPAAVDAMASAASNADFSALVINLEMTMLTSTEEARAGGQEIAAGLAEGISSNAHLSLSAIEEMGQSGIDAFRQKLGIASPSKVFDEHGRQIDEGLAQGVTENTPKVLDAMTGMTDALKAQTVRQLEALKTQMLAVMDTLPGEFDTIGDQTAEGFISGFNRRSGSLYYAVENVVETAIARARRAAATASPSKKTTKIGEDIGEGFVVGFEEKKDRIADKLQGIVDNALQVELSGLPQTLGTALDRAIDASNGAKYDTVPELEKSAKSMANATSRTLKYEADRDYSALMLQAKNYEEFYHLAMLRNAKVAGENIDITAKGWKTTQQIFEEWKKSLQDLGYEADKDYSALMLQAKDYEEFMELAAQRSAKIIGENIDLNEKHWRSNEEIFEEWKESFRALEYEADVDYSALMLKAKDYEEFLQLAQLRNAKIIGENIDLEERGWKTTQEIYEQWMAADKELLYDVDTDYTALIMQAKSVSEAMEYAKLRDAKIVGEHIDLVANGWKTTEEILNEWQAKTETTEADTAAAVEKAAKKAGDLTDAVQEQMDKVEELLRKTQQNFRGIGGSMMTEMAQGIKDGTPRMLEAVRLAISKAIQTANAEGTAAITGDLTSKARAAAAAATLTPEVGPINDRMPRLPSDDSGASVVARAVESALATTRAAGGGQNVSFTLEIPLDGQTLARKTYTYIQREGSRLGGDLVEVAG